MFAGLHNQLPLIKNNSLQYGVAINKNIHLSFTSRNCFLKHNPFDGLVAGRGGKGSLV